MGGKSRIAKYILPLILKDRRPDQWYVEPFCGGCNTLAKVPGPRIGADINSDLIAMWRALQNGWEPPKYVTEEEYRRIEKFGSPELRGYVGFAFSFGAQYFGVFAREVRGKKYTKGERKGNYEALKIRGEESFRGFKKDRKYLNGVGFYNCSFKDLPLPPESVVYCDPPYLGTVSYGEKFNHSYFWDWVRAQSQKHKIFVSEYQAPKDFKVVWEKEIKIYSAVHAHGMGKAIERLFTLK